MQKGIAVLVKGIIVKMIGLINNKLLKKCILVIYTFLLFIVVIMKLYKGIAGVMDERSHIIRDRLDGYMNINLTPLKTLKSNFDFNHGLNITNIIGNTIPFILLGVVISLSESKFSIFKSLITSFFIILFFELMQYITCMGFFDIDDIILNTSAALLGTAIFYLYSVRKIKY